jgi:Carboxypeptidase regulatory-like domain
MKNSLSRRFRAGWCFAVLLALSLSIPCLAQVDVSSQLLGTVTDPTGAVVPNATVIAKNLQTGVEVKAVSDERGNYLFVSLQSGTYSVKCAPPGFMTFVAPDVVLQAQKAATLPVLLQLGSSVQSVEVSAGSEMVDTVSATVQTTYDEKILQTLPVWGRDPRQSMELLMPGAVAAGTGASFNVPVTSFNGMSGLSNNYRIDGSDVNDYFHGAATLFPQSENIAEFSVMTSVPDASVARGAGGQINAILKSGGNDLHGQAWGYFQDGDWNANTWRNNWMGVARQPYSQRWYGGNAGGPVYIPKLYNGKNKTFFFTSYERTSTSQSSTTTGQTISDAERKGDFTNSPDGIPKINGVPTPVIPLSQFSTMGKFLASNTSVLPAPTSGQTTYFWNPSQTEVIRTFTGRIDHNFNEKHRLFGSLWWYNDNPSFDDLFYSFGQASWATQYPNPKATWGLPKTMQSWTLNDTYMLSPSMLNNFILGVKRLDISVTNTYNSSDALFSAKDLGVGSVGDVKAPDLQQISFPRSMGMGIYNGYIDNMTQNSVYVADNFTLNKGRHTVKMGLEIRQYHEVKYQTWGAGGNVGFSDANVNVGGTGNGIADMLLGVAPGFSQNNTQILDIHYPAREAYIQDTYKVSNRLTVMLGARWEPHFGISPTHDNFVTFHPGQSSTVFPTAPVGLVAIGDQGVPGNLYGTRWGNIGPRASFAWDIFGNGKASLRGGYALTRDYQVLLGFNGYTNTAPYGVNYTPNIQTLDLTQPYAEYGSVPFPFKAPVKGDPKNASLVFPSPLNTLAMNPNYNSGAVHQFNATFDFEPFKTYLFSVGYVATRSTHLAETHDFNWPVFVPGTSTNDVTNVRSRRPYFANGFESISMANSDFNAMYNSLQARVNKRYSHGLTLMGNYTLSSNKTQNGCRYWGNCGLDYYSPGTTSNMSAAFAYDLPIPQGHTRSSKMVLGGWTVGGTVMGSTGGYGSIGDYNCSQFNFSSAGCYANFVGTSAYGSGKGQAALDSSGSQIGLRYLDPSAFVRADQTVVNGSAATLPGVGQRLFLGNAITGVFKGPAAFMLNGSLSKNIAITERFKVNYRIEAFNALNHTVLNGPGGTVGPDMTYFGVITSAWDPRKLQMSARFIF